MDVDINYFKKLDKIDRAIQRDTVDTAVLELLKKESIAIYFFDKLKSPRWFEVLNNKGYFDPQYNPKPILIKEKNSYQIPRWKVLPYLEKVAENTRILDQELLQIIMDVSRYKDTEGKHTDNYLTWASFTKILTFIPLSTVPIELFTKAMPVWFTSQFDFTLPGADLLRDLLPAYLNQTETPEDREKVEQLVLVVLALKPFKKVNSVFGESIETETVIDSFRLEESLIEDNTAALIAQKCTNTVILTLASELCKFFTQKFEGPEDYSYIWLSNLNHETTIHSHDGEQTLAVILRKLVLEKAKHSPVEGKELLKEFLSDQYPHYLFKRLALVLINKFWDAYGSYLDTILKTHPEYFNISSLQTELSSLLKNNSLKLTEKQKVQIFAVIDKGPTRYIPKDNEEKYINSWKQNWYKVLDEISEFKKEYEELKKITGLDITPEDREEVGAFKDLDLEQKVIPIEEFLQKTNEEIVEKINKEGDSHDLIDRIYRDFVSAIVTNPFKFTSNLQPFEIKNYKLLSSLYKGITESWKNKESSWKTQKDTMWGDIVSFTKEHLTDETLWNTSKKEQRSHDSNYKWALYEIATLIQEGCRTDSWAFPEELHDSIEDILILLFKRSQKEIITYEKDAVLQAANSSYGKTLEALIFLGLREARLSDKKQEGKQSKWSNSLRTSFDTALTNKEREAYTLLGQYMHNIHYIDSHWIQEKASSIYTLKKKNIFMSFMSGYLFSGKVHEKLYKRLAPAYKRALTSLVQEKYTHERLIQHIAVGYLRGYDTIEQGSFIDILFNQPRKQVSNNIHDIAEFFWHQRAYILEEKPLTEEQIAGKERVLDFWQYAANYYHKNTARSKTDKKALSELSKLTIYLDTLDKKFYDILSLSAPYVTDDFNSPYFLEYLHELLKNNRTTEVGLYIGTLFYEMLKNNIGVPPDYNWTHIDGIVSFLYTLGKEDVLVKQIANNICIHYAEKYNNYGLRNQYEKNNNE